MSSVRDSAWRAAWAQDCWGRQTRSWSEPWSASARRGEVPVDSGDHDRAFADGACDAFDRSCSYVTHCEYAGLAGRVFAGVGRRDRRSGDDVAVVIALDPVRQPVGPWSRADEHEHPGDIELRAAVRSLDGHRA